jgi:hypothetical protein
MNITEEDHKAVTKGYYHFMAKRGLTPELIRSECPSYIRNTNTYECFNIAPYDLSLEDLMKRACSRRDRITKLQNKILKSQKNK